MQPTINLRILIACVAVALLMMVAAEGIARVVLARTDALILPADIQTSETLCLKIDRLRNFEGRKVVVLGDSLALGESMRRHGNVDWRRQEISHAIAAAMPSNQPTLVMNLGLNGGLPADQDVILKLMKDIKLDTVVAFATIRSFSSDFAQPKDAHSRAWFADLAAHGCQRMAKRDLASRVRAFLSDNMMLYRASDLLQRYVLDDSLRAAAASLRTRWGSTKAAAGDGNPQETMFLARRRFLNITYDKPHQQVEAFERSHAALRNQAERTIYVYSREASRQLPSLIGRQAYLRQRAELAKLIGQHCGMVYIDSPEIPAERYIDYVHVDAAGYKLLASQISAADGALQPCKNS
jgi:hypothetical protein